MRPFFFSLFANSDPDAPLVAAARDGDARAFDALVYRYQARLTQFVRARLDSVIECEDVAQDIFVTAWHELPNFKGRSRFKTWLYGIALNRCAEAARKHMRLKRLLGDPGDSLGEWPESSALVDPDDWPASLIERAVIRQWVAGLPEPERQILELYYYTDLNLREISELLELNLSTLKYRFYQAHRRLRENMEGRPAETQAAKFAEERR